MKKLISVSLTVLLLCGSCGSDDTPVSAFRELTGDYPVEFTQRASDWGFEDAVSDANDILRATFTGYIEYDTYYELEFSVDEVLRGETAEDTIRVFCAPSNYIGYSEADGEIFHEYNFIKDHRYLLILSREKSVYYNYDCYKLLGDIFIPLDDDIGVYMHHDPLEGYGDSAAVAGYVEELASVIPDDYTPYKWAGAPYTDATELEDIVSETEYIAILTVENLFYEAQMQNTESFDCTITEILRSKSDIPTNIKVTFFADEIEEGEEYLVLLNRPDDTSLIFALSSKNSVIPLTDTEAVQYVRSLISPAE